MRMMKMTVDMNSEAKTICLYNELGLEVTQFVEEVDITTHPSGTPTGHIKWEDGREEDAIIIVEALRP